MNRLLTWLDNLPHWLILATGFLFVLIIGGIDYVTGDYSILVFYLIPVAFVSWYGGRWGGAAIAVASGIARYIADLPLNLNLLHHYWNAAEDAIFLLVVSLLVALLRGMLEQDPPKA